MSAPQLTDANTSSEWFRKVGESGTADKPRTPSQAALAPSGAGARRMRFVRLVTYTMVGLVAFTLLGVASFAWRQHAMQSALATPVLATPVLAAPEPSPAPALAPEAPPEAVAPPVMPVAAAAPAVVAARAPRKTAKAAKKPVRSPFLSNAKSTASKR